MNLTFHGAARTVTGSRHLLQVNGHRLLLDCGLFQGHRLEMFERNSKVPFEPASINAVLLSHAHIDHSGNLPRLVRDGFSGRIHATPATCDLASLMLRDSAHIQEKDHEFLVKRYRKRGVAVLRPLYETEDAEATIPRFTHAGYQEEFQPVPGAWVRYLDAGHLLGSAMMEIEIEEKGKRRLVAFTGDLGRARLPILRDPAQIARADVLIMESTYGDRFHSPETESESRLAETVSRVAARGGRVIVPAFSVGRSQEVVYALSRLIRAGKIPRVDIFVDSPLSVNATEVYMRHPECFDRETMARLGSGDDPFGFGLIRYVSSVEESKSLNDLKTPAVIISASGMCESGRVLHHLMNSIGDSKNAVLIVGFQAQHTLGRRLVEQAPRVRIFGEEIERRAEVVAIDAFSAHADRGELLAFADAFDRPPRDTYLVHGEELQALALAEALRERGWRVHVPYEGDRAEID
jgi:metallo-beta-lactamase family protein